MESKPRSPKRIRRILRQVEEIWLQYPHLRLLQLLHNSIDPAEHPYFVEDEVLEKQLREKYLLEHPNAAV